MATAPTQGLSQRQLAKSNNRQNTVSTEREHLGGRWVSAPVYSALFGFSTQTLSNWRQQDRDAGLTEPRPGYPIYRKFGTSIRYWVADADSPSRRSKG